MAELKVKFTGDTKELKRQAQDAAQTVGAAEAQMAASAKQADAEILRSSKETARQRLEAAKSAAKEATGEAKAAARQQVADAKAAVKEIAAAERAALKESAALRQAARQQERAEQQAARAADRAQMDAMRRDAIAAARNDAAVRPSGSAGDDGPGGMDLAKGAAKTLALLGLLGVAIERLVNTVGEAERRLSGAQLDAAGQRDGLKDALDLSGVGGDLDKQTNAAIRAGGGKLTPQQIEAALRANIKAGKSFKGRDQQVMDVLSRADPRTIEGALAIVADQGAGADLAVGGDLAVDIAADSYRRNRGTALDAAGADAAVMNFTGRKGVQTVDPLTGRSRIAETKARADAERAARSSELDDTNAVNRIKIDANREARDLGRTSSASGLGDRAANVVAGAVESLGIGASRVGSTPKVEVTNLSRRPGGD